MHPMNASELAAHLECEAREHQREVESFVALIRAVHSEVPDLSFDGVEWRSASAARMCEVEIEIVRAGCEHRHDDPAAVYARPVCTVAGQVVHFTHCYLVATLGPRSLHTEPCWPAEMRADGLPERVIAVCGRQLVGLMCRKDDG